MDEHRVQLLKLGVAGGVVCYSLLTTAALGIFAYFAFPLLILFIPLTVLTWLVLGGAITWETVHRHRSGQLPYLSELAVLTACILALGYSLVRETTVGGYVVTPVLVQWTGAELLAAVVLLRYTAHRLYRFAMEKYR